MPMIPKTTIKKENNRYISATAGIDFRIVQTNPAMPGIEFIVLRGRKIRITLKADTPELENYWEIHPRMTTRQSSCKGQMYLETYDIPRVA